MLKMSFQMIFLNLNSQAKWEYLKYQIRKFSMTFSENLAKEAKQTLKELEDKIKLLEENLNDNNLEDYNKCKNALDILYDNITAGIKIRSRCSWYKHGEKSSKFFLNLEKQRAVNGLLKKVIVNDREISTPLELNREIYEFYQKLFKKSVFKITDKILQFLEVIELPKISNDQFLICEKEISENDLLLSLKGMENNKSPGNDGLKKEF